MCAEELRNDHVLTVYAFLGSATFAALFFLLQSKEIVQNYDFFVGSVAITSILFIVSVVGRLNISVGNIGSNTIYGRVVGALAVLGFFMILLILILLIIQINFFIGVIVGFCTFAFVAILQLAARKTS